MTFLRILRSWLPLACGIFIMSLLVHLTVQQSLRMSANDPQIQIAEDAPSALTAAQIVPAQAAANPIDIAGSLATFTVFYDDHGQPLSGSGLLNGKLPSLPAGIFEHVRQSGESRVSWQPQPGVRDAIVVRRRGRSHPGVVLAGRSVPRAERRLRH